MSQHSRPPCKSAMRLALALIRSRLQVGGRAVSRGWKRTSGRAGSRHTRRDGRALEESSSGPERDNMSSTAILQAVEDRISAGYSPDEVVSVLAQRHGLTADESSAVWLFAHREAEAPGHRSRALRAREILRPLGS